MGKVVVVKQPPSPIDESIFIQCTQTAAGRARGAPPQCSIARWRKVFPHEAADVPLPPEARKEGVYRHGASYLWLSEHNADPARRIAFMSRSLAQEAEFDRALHNAHVERARMAARRPLTPSNANANASATRPAPAPRPVKPKQPLPPDTDLYVPPRRSRKLTPRSTHTIQFEATAENMLGALQRTAAYGLAPTARLLEKTRSSVADGSQLRLMQRFWDDAAPFVLAKNTLARVGPVWAELVRPPVVKADDEPGNDKSAAA